MGFPLLIFDLKPHLQVDFERDGFKWDEHKQGMYLGSFYWLHWLSQIPGGILAIKFGTKTIFGLANYVPCILCFITPIVSYLDYRMLVLLRIISGVCTGNDYFTYIRYTLLFIFKIFD